jgi:hypothetical protein
MNLIEVTSKSATFLYLATILHALLFSNIAIADGAIGGTRSLKITDFTHGDGKHEASQLKKIQLKEISADLMTKVDIMRKKNLHSLQHFLDKSKCLISGISSKKTTGNAQCTRFVANMIAESNRYLSDKVEWDLLGKEDGVTVWKLKRSSLEMNKADGDWPCVKSSVKIDTTPIQLLNYLLDSGKVKEYNKYVAIRSDIETISSNTKIVWSRMNIPIGIKSYDFCTLIHNYIKQDTGDIMVISKCIEHPLVPIHKNFGRSEKIMGLNIIKTIKSTADSKETTEITCISHQRFASTPPFLIEMKMMRGKISYLKNLRKNLEDH